MTEYAFPATLPAASTCTFGENEHVYHAIYFQQAKTIEFIRKSFEIT